MRCTDCELSINSCLGICDARCLVKNDDIDFPQIKTLVESSYWKKNLPLMNIFFQRKAAQMIKAMFSDVRLTIICVAIYKGKLSEKQIAMAKAKSDKVQNILDNEVNIRELILSL
jgi:hypothetical protein